MNLLLITALFAVLAVTYGELCPLDIFEHDDIAIRHTTSGDDQQGYRARYGFGSRHRSWRHGQNLYHRRMRWNRMRSISYGQNDEQDRQDDTESDDNTTAPLDIFKLQMPLQVLNLKLHPIDEGIVDLSDENALVYDSADQDWDNYTSVYLRRFSRSVDVTHLEKLDTDNWYIAEGEASVVVADGSLGKCEFRTILFACERRWCQRKFTTIVTDTKLASAGTASIKLYTQDLPFQACVATVTLTATPGHRRCVPLDNPIAPLSRSTMLHPFTKQRVTINGLATDLNYTPVLSLNCKAQENDASGAAYMVALDDYDTSTATGDCSEAQLLASEPYTYARGQ